VKEEEIGLETLSETVRDEGARPVEERIRLRIGREEGMLGLEDDRVTAGESDIGLEEEGRPDVDGDDFVPFERVAAWRLAGLGISSLPLMSTNSLSDSSVPRSILRFFFRLPSFPYSFSFPFSFVESVRIACAFAFRAGVARRDRLGEEGGGEDDSEEEEKDLAGE
jgi:hypothetical protein